MTDIVKHFDKVSSFQVVIVFTIGCPIIIFDVAFSVDIALILDLFGDWITLLCLGVDEVVFVVVSDQGVQQVL